MMNKSKLMSIILVVISILIIIGVILMWWMLTHQGERSLYNVELDIGQTVSIPFKDVSLLPGDEVEYVIRLDKSSDDAYDLVLDFVERGETTLKKFARVELYVDGELIGDTLLENALDGGAFVIPVDFSEHDSTKIKIVYSLPIEVGNEAKNATAAFDLVFTATTK